MKRFIASLLMSLSLVSAMSAQGGEALPDARIAPGDHPAQETAFVPPFELTPEIKPDPAWLTASGAKKGLSGKADTVEERFLAPDTAILDRGFSPAWPGLLASLQEPAIMVGPNDIAGLAMSKPLLIIPSGALSGTSNSAFFKAGLAEYARSGGVVFCLTQRAGEDYTSLPVPADERIKALGWSQDAGPLFRASSVRNLHLLVATWTNATPAIETDGYFSKYPAGAEVLLARSDGFATMIVYPVGKGWVVLATSFPDFSSLLGAVEPDEITLIKNVLAWARVRYTSSRTPQSAIGLETEKNPTAAPPPAPPRPLKTETQALSRPVVRPSLGREGEKIQLILTIGEAAGLAGEAVLARAAGQEKSLVLKAGDSRIAFDLPLAARGRKLAYALYRSDGRALARGSVAVPAGSGEENMTLDKPFYVPGEEAVVTFVGIGKGELMLSGMGFFDDKIIAEKDSMTMTTPGELPMGAYRLHWDFTGIQGNKKQGDAQFRIAGYQVSFDGVTVTKKLDGKACTALATFGVRASQKIAGRLVVALRDPAGKIITVAEPFVSLVAGQQTIPISFTFTPELAGAWELLPALKITLPSGNGLPAEPVTVAKGSVLFDIGNASMLSLTTDKPLYYEPAGHVAATASLVGSGAARIKIMLDETRVAEENVQLSGHYQLPATLPPLVAGPHIIKATVTQDGLASTRELKFTYGLRLANLSVGITPAEPRPGQSGPVLPVSLSVTNSGKSSSASAPLVLYEGDPSKGGTLAAKSEVPGLAPGQQHTTTVEWLIYKKAGRRTLTAFVATASPGVGPIQGSTAASAVVTIPDALLSVTPDKAAFRSDVATGVTATIFNLTARPARTAEVSLRVTNEQGTTVFTEKLSLPEISANGTAQIHRTLNLGSAAPGTYTLVSALSGEKLPPSETTFSILPTLLLSGTFNAPPLSATVCKPFTARFSVKNSGNIAPTTGSLRLEILPQGTGQPLLQKQTPLVFGFQTVQFGLLKLPPGTYRLRLLASAANAQYSVNEDLVIAEQPFTIAGPIEVKKASGSVPRVLFWLGGSSKPVEQALSLELAKQAFDQETLYARIVKSGEEFVHEAKSGLFNTLVLYEPDETLDNPEWLKGQQESGKGIVLVGPGEKARAIASALGFSFAGSSSLESGTTLSFTDPSGLGLSGNFPVSGDFFSPAKKGAKLVARYEKRNDPAILLDRSGVGKSVVIPFSLSRSALQTGAPELYGLLLRNAVLSAAPESDAAGSGSGQLSVSSTTGPVPVKIKETLPEGSTVIWTGAQGTSSGNVITYEFVADLEPRKLPYLYRAAAGTEKSPATEVFFECEGNFLSQGKVE